MLNVPLCCWCCLIVCTLGRREGEGRREGRKAGEGSGRGREGRREGVGRREGEREMEGKLERKGEGVTRSTVHIPMKIPTTLISLETSIARAERVHPEIVTKLHMYPTVPHLFRGTLNYW